MKKSLLFTLLIPCIAVGTNSYGYTGNNMPSFKKSAGQTIKAITTVKGTVKDAGGQPLIGVNIAVKGTNKGTQSDVNGNFTIDANAGDVLVFTYIGFNKTEVTVTGATVNVVLTSDSKELTEVVVTAFGIKKSEKSLAYATQQVGGDQLSTVKNDNLMNSLNGKVSGVTINPSASGVGGSVKVILRGNKSANGNNQPLYVIDGIPITNGSNSNGQPNSTYGTNVGQGGGAMGINANQDGGDGISNLNPDDIESISVLKGATAAALYGSEAQNGVILITTKKGKAGKPSINFSSSFTSDKIAYQPEFQDSYGQTSAGATTSWGSKIGGASDNLSQFYQSGTNFTNSINISGGNDAAQSFFSYANTTADGVEPGNKLERNNVNFRETAHYNKLTVDGSANYISQTINNTPGLGFYLNPLTGLYLFPRGLDITPYKTNYEIPAALGGNGAPTQNWPFNEDVQQNPWWTTNNDPNISTRNRFLFNASVKYDVAKWLSIQARGNIDYVNDEYQQDLYAGTNPVYAKSNGQFVLGNQVTEQKYADFLATFTAPGKSDIKLDGVLGASIKDINTNGTLIGPDASNSYAGTGLLIPNVFLPQNLVTAAGGPPVSTVQANHSQIQSLFANANLSYKNWAYLTLTARNDWSSNLAYTPTYNFFYPSAGLSLILNQMFKLPEVISYAKIRGSYAQVGNTVPPYVTNPLAHFGIGSSIVLNSAAPFPTLVPERTNNIELGTDLRFFNDRLTFGFTYYKTNTLHQAIQLIPASTTTYGSGYVNAGNIENKGVEFNLGYDVFKGKDFSWNTSINASANKNTILDLDSKQGINQFVITPNNNNSYESILAKGGSYGDIYGVTFKRDGQGRILIGADGSTPETNNGFNYLGNPNPKFQLGWNNSFTYQKFSLGFLVDGKFGGQVLSLTQAEMDQYGVSKVSGDARNAGGVAVNGVSAVTGAAITSVNPQIWYSTVGGRAGITEDYMYSATVVRLREASLGYTIPLTGAIKSLKLSLIGHNLIYFYKKAPFDPEISMSTGNGLSGVDVFNQPATRNYGFSLNATF
ncbi:SusC/RagA family TonB-linked outer membrane protein [Mucilaginibacter sp. X4EP1]|uniref:SusC/RagA family TonB-linked outer membrane protein n=1 Tax=Mucilaginibacter sp. X4EP1 TaxID=2723092 RepID=UPI002166FBE9|nr:SusC/RagA family TonB-linked outer membrane protein [Mucilaginibacter sp. X4EP1]MCS3814832.1 TonB-linked SusC/RagA family outer membrane protein [Mucilaginibacter sp. X4EP1]